MKTLRLLLAALAPILFGCHIQAASTAISALPAASSVAPTNLTIVVDLTEPNPNLQTKKANVTQLVDGLPAASAGAKGTMSAADKIKLDASTASATVSTLALRDSSGNTSFNSIALTAGTVSGAPVNPTDITNKAYVDAVSSGLAVHTPAAAGTVGTNITLAGGAPSTLDGVTLALNSRILVKDQTTATQNGIYIVSVVGSGANGTWVRASDANSGSNLVSGSYIFVSGGTTNANAAYVMTTPGAITIGVSNINWTLFNQITNILASSIVGQIVQAQIADAAISTAKFAAGIEPVSIVSSLPSPSGYTGPKNLFNTSDSKLYRYNGAAFTSAVATTDLSGTITNTQIADNSISTPKLQANVVTAAKIATGTITSNEIASSTIVAGNISAGAVGTTELAANAVTAAKILAGTITTTQIASATILAGNIAAGTITGSNIAANTITATNLNVGTLSAISANVGTLTAGSIGGWTITTTTISATVGSSSLTLDSTIPQVSVARGLASGKFFTDDPGTGNRAAVTLTYNSQTRVELSASNLGAALLRMKDGSNFLRVDVQAATAYVSLKNASGTETISLTGGTGATITSTLLISGATISGGGIGTTALQNLDIDMSTGSSNKVNISCGEAAGTDHTFASYISVWANGRTIYVPFLTTAP